MLEEIRVRDLALIEDVSLELGPGMNVLTGETGAGKTALVGAIKLLIGERADATLVRAGAAEAIVEGRLEIGDDQTVVRRRVTAGGRSKCAIDGSMATVGELAETFGPLFDLHGQHEHQSLLDTATHVGFLDRFAGDEAHAAREAYLNARETYQSARAEYERTEKGVRETAEKADYLRFVIEEIEAVAPEADEVDLLRERMPGLQHAERLTEAASEAYSAIRSEHGAVDSLAVALAALGRMRDVDPRLDEMTARLEPLATDTEDLAGDLREYAEGLEHDPAALDAAQRRLATLEDLQKKHGPTLEDVVATAERARADLERLDGGDEELARQQERVESTRQAFTRRAAELAAIREAAAAGFVDALARAAEDLSMLHARFEVSFDDLPEGDWSSVGSQAIEFLYAPGADQPARPLSRIASGGELSRVMLGLKGVLGRADEVPVLVFDEVDAGIGGAAATSVGERLRDLSEGHQVLVVTHLAQVAALADRHLVVEKDSSDAGVATLVRVVDGDDRAREVARMLSGSDTDASLTHAHELLDGVEARTRG